MDDFNEQETIGPKGSVVAAGPREKLINRKAANVHRATSSTIPTERR